MQHNWLMYINCGGLEENAEKNADEFQTLKLIAMAWSKSYYSLNLLDLHPPVKMFFGVS